jgi:hypothetical protein
MSAAIDKNDIDAFKPAKKVRNIYMNGIMRIIYLNAKLKR